MKEFDTETPNKHCNIFLENILADSCHPDMLTKTLGWDIKPLNGCHPLGT